MIFNVGSGGSSGGGGTNLTYLDGTLEAGQTELTITSSDILEDTIISEVALSKFGIVIDSISASVGSVTLSFKEAQTSAIKVRVGVL